MSNEEKKWLQRAQQGDSDAFTLLYTRYSGPVYTLCLRLCGNDADAQDAVQEAMIKAWKNIGGFHFQSRFSTWLYRIAVNCCYDILRRRKKHPVSVDALQEAGEDLPQPGFEDALANTAALKQALAQLKGEYRAVLVLREMQQLSYEEIAQVLRLPVGTVRSRLNRARVQLREICLQNGTFLPQTASNNRERN